MTYPNPSNQAIIDARVKERIQKVLAAAGVASRRNVEELVLQGRVAVNGRIVTRLPVLIDRSLDRVTVDDEPIRFERGAQQRSQDRVYLLMNKPAGVYSTNVAQGEQVRAIDLLPRNFPHRVFPVGRLDAESKGLLLLTNDGELTNQLTHPRYGVAKTYRAIVDGILKSETIEQLQKGIWLADPHRAGRTGGGFKTGRSRIRLVKRLRDKSILEITIREGRNRQIRRMLAKMGHKVRDLTRIKMGPLTLQRLAPGQFRPLTSRELKELRSLPMNRRARRDGAPPSVDELSDSTSC